MGWNKMLVSLAPLNQALALSVAFNISHKMVDTMVSE